VSDAARPADVHITDLTAPTFDPEIAVVRTMMSDVATTLTLTPEAIIADASTQTGLEDLGDDWFREPLSVLCTALRDEAGLSPAGLTNTYVMLVNSMKNRLLVQDVVRRDPSVLDAPVEAPIIIAGLPRTGTTHLHNLISADPALRSLAYWESLEPVLASSEVVAPGEMDPRIARTDAALQFVNGAMPYFVRMHEMTVDHVHEEIQLLACTFSTMFFETTALMPSWRDYYKATDQTPAYEYLRTVLQVLSAQRGAGKRWVLKSPQHLEQFAVLTKVFPDATYVVTHRDPAAVAMSLAMMTTYTARMSIERIDPFAYGAYWTDRVGDLLSACLRDRDLLPADRSVDVTFTDFMADDVATVERIYAAAGQPFTAGVRAAMDDFMSAHPRGRHGRVEYHPDEFGIDVGAIRQLLAAYVDRFGVEPETIN
jgi:hypothetical protein